MEITPATNRDQVLVYLNTGLATLSRSRICKSARETGKQSVYEACPTAGARCMSTYHDKLTPAESADRHSLLDMEGSLLCHQVCSQRHCWRLSFWSCRKMKRVTELDVKLMQRINLFFCWKLGWTHKDACAALRTVYGQELLHASRTRHWYSAFQSGRTSIVDMQRSPREKTGRCDQNIQDVRTIVNTDPSLTVHAIATQTRVSPSTIHRILTKDLHLSLRCAKLLPNVLTPRHIVERFTHARDMLNRTRMMPSFLKKIVTMDEAWFYQYNPETKRQASQWLTKDQPRPTHPKRTLSIKKTMLVAFFDHKGMVHMEFVRHGTVNTPVFIGILARYKESLRRCRPHLTRHLHMDNAPAHGARDTRLHLLMTGQRVVDHPALSPDLAPSDFWLFPRLKKVLRGHHFPSLDALEMVVRDQIGQVTAAEYKETILTKWPMQWSRCVLWNGDYFEGR